MKVPTYDSAQVREQPLAPAQMRDAQPIWAQINHVQDLRVPNVVAEQNVALGKSMESAGNALGDVGAKMQMEMNQARVDDAFNQVQSQSQALLKDPKTGFYTLQGKNALEGPDGKNPYDTYMEHLNDAVSAAHDGLSNDVQKQVFNQKAAALTVGYSSDLMSHVTHQQGVYQVGVAKGKQQNALQGIATDWSDPLKVDQWHKEFTDGVRDELRVHGLDDEGIVKSEVLSRGSKALASGVTSALDHGSQAGIAKAQAMLDGYSKRGMLAGDDILTLQTQIQNARNDFLVNRVSDAAVMRFSASENPTAFGKLGAAIDVAESSGGIHWNRNGDVLKGPDTRYGNAFGKHQILESTAKQAANAPGGPGWDRDLFYQRQTGDPVQDAKAVAYHDALQASHLNSLLQRYPNDPKKVMAAYNWGEGNVDQVVKEHGDDWLAHAPKSVQEYVDKVSVAFGKQGGAGNAETQLAQNVKEMMPPNTPQKVIDQAISTARSKNNQMESDMKQQESTQVSNAIQKLIANKGDISQLNQSDLIGVSPDKQVTLRNLANNIRSGNDKSNPETVAELRDWSNLKWSETNEDEFRSQYADKLSTTALQSYVDKMNGIKNKDPEHLAKGAQSEQVSRAAREFGIIPKDNTAKMSKDQTGDYNAFASEVDNRVRQFELANKTKATDKDLQKIMSDVRADQVYKPSVFSWLGVGPNQAKYASASTDERGNMFVTVNHNGSSKQVNLAAIPQEFKEEAARKFYRHGVPVTQQNIAEYWIKTGG